MTFWRRQTGVLGFAVEWTMWLSFVTFAVWAIAWSLQGLAWLLRAAS